MNFTGITTEIMQRGIQYVTADDCLSFNQALIDENVKLKITIAILAVSISLILLKEIKKIFKKEK